MKASHAWEAEASWGWWKSEKVVSAASWICSRTKQLPSTTPSLWPCCCPGRGQVSSLYFITINWKISILVHFSSVYASHMVLALLHFHSVSLKDNRGKPLVCCWCSCYPPPSITIARLRNGLLRLSSGMPWRKILQEKISGAVFFFIQDTHRDGVSRWIRNYRKLKQDKVG